MESLQDGEKEATQFMVSCYGKKGAQSLTECRQQMWAQKTAKIGAGAPKLATLPPTTEAFHQNVLRAHLTVANWLRALEKDPSDLNPVDYGWHRDDVNKMLLPCTVGDEIMKLMQCGCKAATPCKVAAVYANQIVCHVPCSVHVVARGVLTLSMLMFQMKQMIL